MSRTVAPPAQLIEHGEAQPSHGQGVGIRRLAARSGVGWHGLLVGRAKRRATHNGERVHRPSDAGPATDWIADSPQADFVRTSGTANSWPCHTEQGHARQRGGA